MPNTPVVTDTPTERLEKLEKAVVYEANNVLLKAFRGGLDMSEPDNRVLVATAATRIAAHSRDEQSKRAARHSDFAMAVTLEGRGVKLDAALALTMPDDPVAIGYAEHVTKKVGPGNVAKG